MNAGWQRLQLCENKLSAGAIRPSCLVDFAASLRYIRRMKTLKSTIIVALLALFVVGCGGTEKILPKKDGTWRTTALTYSSFINSALDSTWTDTQVYTYVFDKTGSATLTDALGTTNVTWYVNPDGDLMTICQNTVGSQTCIQYLIQTSEKDLQRWKATILGAANGTYVEVDMSLERVE